MLKPLPSDILIEIDDKHGQIKALCQRFGVTRLELFGSALSNRFSGQSDLDFLVWFNETKPAQRAIAYFDFWFALEDLFAKPVDLLVENALQNPFFDRGVTKVLYAA